MIYMIITSTLPLGTVLVVLLTIQSFSLVKLFCHLSGWPLALRLPAVGRPHQLWQTLAAVPHSGEHAPLPKVPLPVQAQRAHRRLLQRLQRLPVRGGHVADLRVDPTAAQRQRRRQKVNLTGQ